MLFFTLLLLQIGIVLLYSAYMNIAPFIVIQSFISGKPIEQ